MKCVLALVPAFLLFAFLFLKSAGFFWLCLPVSVVILCAIAWMAEPRDMRGALRQDGSMRWPAVLSGGIISAAALYLIFFAGNLAARRLLPFGAAEIEAVYRQGAGTPRWIVALILLLIVGPGEEVFWRGYVQRRLTADLGAAGTLLAIIAYTGVHAATGNLTLILAALVCGAFWGLLYRLTGSLWINIISHGVWAAAVFVVWPLA